ncbi:YitT family protein [Mesorhizobium sp. J428]|uniref:YitT family protein n=1 Tax=Mesorhizobium sp. J428 TaxID=2898440 RepID=UPI002150E4AB|nr:YitT family protein [Mesorhizobium sp. J428]MCR5858957.1 YitT family protein [Mesorhizobium sp. J428]
MSVEDAGRLPEQKHRLYEDVLALLLGTLLASLGVTLYTEATLATGGVAGVSMLVNYLTGYGFGPIFFVVNLPFYALAILRMGWPYTLRTFAAVALLSLFSRLTPGWIDIAALDPLYAAATGGGLIGMGLLILFRHRAGLGGLNILALYLQDKGIMRAGWFQLAVDVMILVAAFFVLPLEKVALSLVGAAVVNLILGINHKPGRYMGMS